MECPEPRRLRRPVSEGATSSRTCVHTIPARTPGPAWWGMPDLHTHREPCTPPPQSTTQRPRPESSSGTETPQVSTSRDGPFPGVGAVSRQSPMERQLERRFSAMGTDGTSRWALTTSVESSSRGYRVTARTIGSGGHGMTARRGARQPGCPMPARTREDSVWRCRKQPVLRWSPTTVVMDRTPASTSSSSSRALRHGLPLSWRQHRALIPCIRQSRLMTPSSTSWDGLRRSVRIST